MNVHSHRDAGGSKGQLKKNQIDNHNSSRKISKQQTHQTVISATQSDHAAQKNKRQVQQQPKQNRSGKSKPDRSACQGNCRSDHRQQACADYRTRGKRGQLF
ncbi:hypothetical protein SDC9_87021 [bioreactor metagenome]|uniref:Uncharacterized protein n=1 Tax=bioreactor metagenome TaxID=1076179 RepID=A0A644ZKI5_9ZZZZ